MLDINTYTEYEQSISSQLTVRGREYRPRLDDYSIPEETDTDYYAKEKGLFEELDSGW